MHDFYENAATQRAPRRRRQIARAARPKATLGHAVVLARSGPRGSCPSTIATWAATAADKCEIRAPWNAQIAVIDIDEPDAISDDGQEVFNLLQEQGIDNILIAGVHLNMCVLGRSFAIRQMVKLGKNVILVRDLTDTMYNSRDAPFVNHFAAPIWWSSTSKVLVPDDHERRPHGGHAVSLPRRQTGHG